MSSDDPREESFLRGRQSRSEVVESSLAGRREKQEAQDKLWESYKASLGEWERKLEKVQETGVCRTAQQRTLVSNQLRDLQSTLQLQLSSPQNDDLSPSDLRLLHKEMTRLSNSLEKLRSDLIPPNKFTFRRYRKAWNERQRCARPSEEIRNDERKCSETPKTPHPTQLNTETTIQGFTNVSVVEVGARRTVESLIATQGQSSVLEVAASSSALLLKDLTNCKVSLNSQTYKAIHLQNVQSTTLQIHDRVEGAIHVTGGSELTLEAAFCHQLRLHESKKLQLTVTVGSSPILENCSEVEFRVTPEHRASSTKELLRDTKDFNWLRNDVPSPNFTVVEVEKSPTTDDHRLPLRTSDEGPKKQIESNPQSTMITQNSRKLESDVVIAEEDDSSDEDEI